MSRKMCGEHGVMPRVPRGYRRAGIRASLRHTRRSQRIVISWRHGTVERQVVGEIIVRILFAMESLAWALVLMYGVSLRLATLERDFGNLQAALIGELIFTCFALLMMLLAIVGLIRARGLLFSNPILNGASIVARAITLVPLTTIMLSISAAGFAA